MESQKTGAKRRKVAKKQTVPPDRAVDELGVPVRDADRLALNSMF